MQTVKYTHQPNENNKNYSATNLSYTTEVAQTMVGIISTLVLLKVLGGIATRTTSGEEKCQRVGQV